MKVVAEYEITVFHVLLRIENVVMPKPVDFLCWSEAAVRVIKDGLPEATVVELSTIDGFERPSFVVCGLERDTFEVQFSHLVRQRHL